METEAKEHPTNVQNLLSLGSAYFEMQQTDHGIETFDKALASPAISYAQAAGLAGFYSKLGPQYFEKLEAVLERLAVLAPDQPEARYDLAAMKVVRGKTAEALENLRSAMDLSAKRLKKDPKARDLAANYRTDNRFDSVRNLPEFQKLVPPQ
jgi:cytochrome c-type biogenesis protein CcmH/NrfG